MHFNGLTLPTCKPAFCCPVCACSTATAKSPRLHCKCCLGFILNLNPKTLDPQPYFSSGQGVVQGHAQAAQVLAAVLADNPQCKQRLLTFCSTNQDVTRPPSGHLANVDLGGLLQQALTNDGSETGIRCRVSLHARLKHRLCSRYVIDRVSSHAM